MELLKEAVDKDCKGRAKPSAKSSFEFLFDTFAEKFSKDEIKDLALFGAEFT